MVYFRTVPCSLPLQKHWLIFSNIYCESLAQLWEVILVELWLDIFTVILLYIIVITGGFSFSGSCVNSFCNAVEPGTLA